MPYTYVPVVGTFRFPDGSPALGSVTFTPPTSTRDSVGAVAPTRVFTLTASGAIPANSTVARLDDNGTTTPDSSPEYAVRVQVGGSDFTMTTYVGDQHRKLDLSQMVDSVPSGNDARIHVGPAAPSNPSEGDIWFDTGAE